MTNPVARVVSVGMYGDDTAPRWRSIYLWCPACDHLKGIPLPGEDGALPPNGPYWGWDGNLEAPTLSPSILQHGSGNLPQCHSFLKNGRWEFLSDYTHKLAGQTVDMVPLPDWVCKEK
jgi:hypothetical protein